MSAGGVKDIMKRIILHHTGGSYKPNEVDLKAYHYLIDNQGNIYEGYFKPEDNENCQDGRYATHTLKGNTGSIGIAACCNYGYDINKKQSLYPFTKKQFDTMVNLCAKLATTYHIETTNIFTHYWFDKCHGIKQGKSDITYLPWCPNIAPDEVIKYFRQEIDKIREEL